MNKAELITAVAEKAAVSKKDADKAISALIDVVVEAVAAGEKIQIGGFGTFEARTRAARVGINPQTKEKISISASKVPGFKAGKVFKNAVK